jgi:hypothetical protein
VHRKPIIMYCPLKLSPVRRPFSLNNVSRSMAYYYLNVIPCLARIDKHGL